MARRGLWRSRVRSGAAASGMTGFGEAWPGRVRQGEVVHGVLRVGPGKASGKA